ncbi:hypothetical protein GCM10023259_064040 [Thermocatellispora tengchongensis]
MGSSAAEVFLRHAACHGTRHSRRVLPVRETGRQVLVRDAEPFQLVAEHGLADVGPLVREVPQYPQFEARAAHRHSDRQRLRLAQGGRQGDVVVHVYHAPDLVVVFVPPKLRGLPDHSRRITAESRYVQPVDLDA